MKEYTVFTDFHHSGLLRSLILLFEKRFGGRVYRPIGREWHTRGYWHIYDHPATVGQYLDIGGATPDDTPPLNELESDHQAPWIYHCRDIDSLYGNKAITYEGFMSLPFDIVIASIPQHVEPFKELVKIHPSNPKLIFQIGNQWDGKNTALNIMASAKIQPIGGINFISYHQEFPLEIFYPAPPNKSKNIFSFINVFDQDLFREDWELFKKVEKMMPEWTFKSFGGQGRDGVLHGDMEVAAKMRECRWAWHTKKDGDGYGHVIHNIPAVGRPMIVKAKYYRGKLAESLLKDGQTCIFIDGLNPEQIVKKIEHFNNPHRYNRMCKVAYENFQKEVDFDKEADLIGKFLENLV